MEKIKTSKVIIKDIPTEGVVKALVLDIRTAIKFVKGVNTLNSVIGVVANSIMEDVEEDCKTLNHLQSLTDFLEEIVNELEK